MAPSHKKIVKINKDCIILKIKRLHHIKNDSFNGFQLGHFCPKGTEMHNSFFNGNGGEIVKFQ